MDAFYCKTPGVLSKYRGTDSTVIIPAGIHTIDYGAFYQCSYIEKVILGDEVVKIDDYAFSEAEKLQEVHFGKALQYIGEHAFSHTRLRCVRIPGTVKTIEDYSFWSCRFLAEVWLGEGCQQIKDRAFACTEEKCSLHIHFPSSITDIEDQYTLETKARYPRVVIYSPYSDYILKFCRWHYHELSLDWRYEPSEGDILAQILLKDSENGKLEKKKQELEKIKAELAQHTAALSRKKAEIDALSIFQISKRKSAKAEYDCMCSQKYTLENKIKNATASIDKTEHSVAHWNSLSQEQKRSSAENTLRQKGKKYEKAFAESDKHSSISLDRIMELMRNTGAGTTSNPDPLGYGDGVSVDATGM